jgi:hypothetical protein
MAGEPKYHSPLVTPELEKTRLGFPFLKFP